MDKVYCVSRSSQPLNEETEQQKDGTRRRGRGKDLKKEHDVSEMSVQKNVQ